MSQDCVDRIVGDAGPRLPAKLSADARHAALEVPTPADFRSETRADAGLQQVGQALGESPAVHEVRRIAKPQNRGCTTTGSGPRAFEMHQQRTLARPGGAVNNARGTRCLALIVPPSVPAACRGISDVGQNLAATGEIRRYVSIASVREILQAFKVDVWHLPLRPVSRR